MTKLLIDILDLPKSYYRAIFSLFVGKFDEALMYFNQAHSLRPQHGVPVINKANVFMAMGKHQDAENTLKKYELRLS